MFYTTYFTYYSWHTKFNNTLIISLLAAKIELADNGH